MAFLTDILAGFILGCGYDFLKAVRIHTKYKTISAICDLIFWLFSCSMILFVFFITSDMKLRAYEFFGLLTGLFLYFISIARWTFPVYEKITFFLQVFFKILFTSIIFFGIMVKNCVLWITKPLWWVFKRLKWILAFPILAFKENWKLTKRI